MVTPFRAASTQVNGLFQQDRMRENVISATREGFLRMAREARINCYHRSRFVQPGLMLKAAAQAEQSHEIRKCRVPARRSLHSALWAIAIKRYWSAERGEPTIPGKHYSRLDGYGITGPTAASTAADKVVDRGAFNPSAQRKRQPLFRQKRITKSYPGEIGIVH